MNIKHIFGPMDTKLADILDMELSDRLAVVRDARTPEQQAEIKKKDEILEKIAGEYFKDYEKITEFLNMTVFCEGSEVENAYLCGIKDGMRIQRVIDNIHNGI